jgi:hypothetical protein
MVHSLPPIEYLSTESCRQNFQLSRLNRARNLSKEIGDLIEEWVEEAALALLADWVRLYGPRLPVSRGGGPAVPANALSARADARQELRRKQSRSRRGA